MVDEATERGRSPQTIEAYQFHMLAVLKSFKGETPLDRVTSTSIEQWRRERLAAGVSSSTVTTTSRCWPVLARTGRAVRTHSTSGESGCVGAGATDVGVEIDELLSRIERYPEPSQHLRSSPEQLR